MTKLKNLIERIFTKKNIKIFLLLFVVVWFFVWSSFAQTQQTETTLTPLWKASHILNIVISILSWWWVILATLAWKFMTNDFVYGTFLNLDSSLWNLWNIIKNFANISLWLILVFTIVKNLFKTSFWDGSPIQNAKDTVISTLIAWILIQMSRFLIAVLVDLATIGTAAVWALPSQFMAGDSNFQGDLTRLVWNVENKIEIDFSNTWNIVNIIRTWDLVSQDDVNKFLDTILPSSSSMVWPFIFLWASVFNLYDLTDSSKNLSWVTSRWDLFLSLWINWFVLFIFSLTLALIFVFNLFRVITLWVIIPLSPFILMLFAFSRGWKSPMKLEWFFWEITSVKNILKLIFMPVYMTLVLSIILIVMVLVRTLVNANNWWIDLTEHNNMTIQSHRESDNLYDSSLNVSDIANIKMKMKKSIVDILVYCICLILMVILVKSCVSKELTWIKFIDNRINWLSEILWWKKGELWWFLWKTWVIPIWQNGRKIWIWTAINYVKEAPDRLNRKLEERQQNQDSAIRKALWLDNTSGDFDSLKIIANSEVDREDWLKRAAQIWRNKWYRLTADFDKDTSFKAAMKYFNDHKVGIVVRGVSSDDVVGQMGKEDEEAKKSSENESTEWKTS